MIQMLSSYLITSVNNYETSVLTIIFGNSELIRFIEIVHL